jgi:DNA-binding NarL/FixJ family response regulator
MVAGSSREAVYRARMATEARLAGRPATGRPPIVGVKAPAPMARGLTAVLERGELAAVEPPRSPRLPAVDVLVVGAASAPDKPALDRLRRGLVEAKLVLVVGAATPAEARQLLVDDVPGLVLAHQVGETLCPTVRAVAADQICYPAELMPSGVRGALSKREKQVLGMVVLGFSNAEIATKLFVSQSTVKSHLSSAFATLGVRTRKEAVALILDPDAGFGTGILAITEDR